VATRKPETFLWTFLVFKMETLKSSSSYNESKTFSLEFFCAGLVFKGFCFYGWGCVQGEGENNAAELNCLVGKLHVVAGSSASSGNQFQCPVLTGGVLMLSLVVHKALQCVRSYCIQKLSSVHYSGEAERSYLQVK